MKSSIILVRRLTRFALVLALFIAPLSGKPSSLTATAQDLVPTGTLSELSLDDGQANCAAGTGAAANGRGFGWANKLTPTSYPATLRSITIGFNRILIGQSVVQDALYRIVVYLDPEGDGPADNQEPAATFTGRVRGAFDDLMTFNLITPITITSGSFVVGAIDDFGFGPLPALLDIPGKATPPGSASYVSFNAGGNWKTQAAVFANTPNCESSTTNPHAVGSWLIRAAVESNPVELPTVTRIKDPAAVEPWGVAVSGGTALVTNYVSDNLTIINTLDNTFQNVAVGDGTGGAADGPYGVVTNANEDRVYVTLFGSNTIPTKEFPIDYATVADNGRVAVLTKQVNGTFTQTSLITVGKGPRFPAITPPSAGAKLYVPCGGANRVDVINTATNAKIKEIAVGNDPSSCTYAAVNGKIYVTNSGDGTISVLDIKTDTKIKDISIPATAPPAPGLPPLPPLKNPVSAAISSLNNNLYVAYNGANDNPNGAIVEIDTCKDMFVRVVTDQTTTGTAAGAAGASGIAAPTSALTRDAATGLTPNAGGGGGGPFGIAAANFFTASHFVVFTNDALGIVGAIDAAIDQVMTAPAIVLANCPKPRGIAYRSITPPCGSRFGCAESSRLAYVACGQPDSSVLIIALPSITGTPPTVPVITFADIGKKMTLSGRGFVNGARIEVIDPVSGVCLTFANPPKVRNEGKELFQRPPFSDGRTIKEVIKGNANAYLRVVNPDGSTFFFIRRIV
ncbi:MAG: YncE family protein [Acidobacteria bacterium]|nr:YncE family protein [Acidobacteriota bacterium]